VIVQDRLVKKVRKSSRRIAIVVQDTNRAEAGAPVDGVDYCAPRWRASSALGAPP